MIGRRSQAATTASLMWSSIRAPRRWFQSTWSPTPARAMSPWRRSQSPRRLKGRRRIARAARIIMSGTSTCWCWIATHACSTKPSTPSAATGPWSSDSETIWDLKNYEQRPWGWTSADAAGLPIFPGLVRYDEVASGAINHAIRFTLPHTKNDANGGYFVEPASHAAGTDYGVSNVMGMRIRLKASFDISRLFGGQPGHPDGDEEVRHDPRRQRKLFLLPGCARSALGRQRPRQSGLDSVFEL